MADNPTNNSNSLIFSFLQRCVSVFITAPCTALPKISSQQHLQLFSAVKFFLLGTLDHLYIYLIESTFSTSPIPLDQKSYILYCICLIFCDNHFPLRHRPSVQNITGKLLPCYQHNFQFLIFQVQRKFFSILYNKPPRPRATQDSSSDVK